MLKFVKQKNSESNVRNLLFFKNEILNRGGTARQVSVDLFEKPL